MGKKYIREIIADHLHNSNLSLTKFAKNCDLSPSYMSQVIRNRNPTTGRPPVLTIEAYSKIANGMDISLDDLLLMLKDSPIELNRNAKGNAQIINIGDMQRHKIPLIGSVAGGEPIYDEETDLYIDGPIKASCALRLKGDSMAPTYLQGDIIYVREQPEVRSGQVAVVFLDDQCTLKHVYKSNNGLQLISDNPKYPPINVSFDDYDYIRILCVPCGYTRLYDNATVEF